METALMLHSQLLERSHWEKVMVGDPAKGIYGVYTKGQKIAEAENVRVVVFGAGLPLRNDCHRLVQNKAYIRKRIKEIVPGFRSEIKVIIDEGSQNTAEEVQFAAERLAGLGIKRVVSVTPPKHAPRALRDFLACQDRGGFSFDVEISSVASMVDLPDAFPRDVCILEPFHRPDLKSYALHQYGAAMVEIMKRRDPEEARRFFQELERLLELHGADPRWKADLKPDPVFSR